MLLVYYYIVHKINKPGYLDGNCSPLQSEQVWLVFLFGTDPKPAPPPLMQVQQTYEDALAQDPTVFDYDGV